MSTVDDFMRRLGPGWAFVIDAQGDPVFYRKSDKAAAEAARKIDAVGPLAGCSGIDSEGACPGSRGVRAGQARSTREA